MDFKWHIFLADYSCSFSLPRSVGGKRTKSPARDALGKRALFLPKECLRQKVFFEGFFTKGLQKPAIKSYPYISPQ
jgi:hypothetical protein